jgi:hypothetical protein
LLNLFQPKLVHLSPNVSTHMKSRPTPPPKKSMMYDLHISVAFVRSK